MGEGSVDQAVECRIMSRVRRGAHDLDLEAFGNVTRIGVRDIRRRVLLAVLNLDHTQAVVQYPLVILVADYKLQRCLVRIVELMRLRFFAVVLCDIRRGLDGHVVFPRLIQSRRFRPVERLALRVVDQVVVFRPAAGRADVLYLNLPDSRFQIVIGGSRNKRGLRIFCFPDRVEVGDLGGCCNRIAAFDRDSRIVRIPIPAEEFVAVSSWLLAGNGERHLAGVGLFSLRSRYTIFIAAVGVVVQGVGDLRVGILRDQIDRRTLVAGRRPTPVEIPRLRVRIRFLAPANDLIAAVHSCSARSRLDVADGDNVVAVGPVAVIRRVLANKLRLFRRAVIVADVELIADIKNGERYIDLMAGIQRLRTDVTVSRKCRHRQHAEHHNQN